MRLPFLASIPLPTERDALVERAQELIEEGFALHGYVRATTRTGDRFVFLLEGETHCAGESLGNGIVPRGVRETILGLTGVSEASFCSTDLPLLLCTAVPFRKAPAASIPLELVDPETLLESIASTEKDAVLVIRQGALHTLVFCAQGTPRALYTADIAFPEGTDIPDRIVEYVLGDPSRKNITIDVYDQIRLPPVSDAGRPLSSYLIELDEPDEPDEPVETREPVWLVVKLGGRVVFHHPMSADEIVVGRGLGADLVLDNLSVSRSHASVRRDGRVLIVTDLGGANGLTVGGQKKQKIDLRPGDEVGIGKYTLRYARAEPSEDARVPPPAGPRLGAIDSTVTIQKSSHIGIEHRGETHAIPGLVFKIGTGPQNHIRISGWFVAPLHARFLRQADGSYRLQHVAGRRAVKVNGVAVRDAVMSIGDQVEIGRERFVLRVL